MADGVSTKEPSEKIVTESEVSSSLEELEAGLRKYPKLKDMEVRLMEPKHGTYVMDGAEDEEFQCVEIPVELADPETEEVMGKFLVRLELLDAEEFMTALVKAYGVASYKKEEADEAWSDD